MFRPKAFVGLLVLVLQLALVSSLSVPAFSDSYEDLAPVLGADMILSKRYVTTFTAPTNYRYSWGIDGKRVSYGTSTGQYLTRSTLSGATSVGQNEVNRCATLCNSNSRCGFFHPVQMRGGSEGAVICALYTVKQDKAAATFTTGAGSNGGTVTFSYGFTKNAVTTTSSTTTSRTSTTTSRTSTTTSRTSTTTSATTTGTTTTTTTTTTSTTTSAPSSTNTFPASPPGATLIQFKPCSSSSATIPMFVNKNYPISGSSSSSTVWIVQHGSARNFDEYFTSLYNVVGDQGIVISPQFYATSDTPTYSGGKADNWYQPNSNLAWNSNDFNFGADAVAPSGTGACSSFDVYDTLISLVRGNKSKFPNVSRVVIVAHSGGSNLAARYGMLTSNGGIQYVLANHASMPYFTSARPETADSQAGCTGIENWQYGWSGSLPRWVAARNPGAVNAFKAWIQKDVVLMTGTLDTFSRYPSGDQSCQVKAQGGQNRRDRGYAWWAYLNILAGTGADVSAYYGYDNLRASGATNIGGGTSFNLRHCIVDNVGHEQSPMFASACGRAAIFGNSIPAGPGPIRP